MPTYTTVPPRPRRRGNTLRHVSASARTLRADAARNRDALLVAAREVFAERGLQAPLDAVAERAGVGRATMKRRFASRDDLLRAIFDDNLDEFERLAASHADREDGFFVLLEAAARTRQRDIGFIEAFARDLPEGDAPTVALRRFIDVMTPPLRRAQDAGLVRGDLEPEDTTLLIGMLGVPAGAPAADSRRALTLVRDALDPRGARRRLEARAPAAGPAGREGL